MLFAIRGTVKDSTAQVIIKDVILTENIGGKYWASNSYIAKKYGWTVGTTKQAILLAKKSFWIGQSGIRKNRILEANMGFARTKIAEFSEKLFPKIGIVDPIISPSEYQLPDELPNELPNFTSKMTPFLPLQNKDKNKKPLFYNNNSNNNNKYLFSAKKVFERNMKKNHFNYNETLHSDNYEESIDFFSGEKLVPQKVNKPPRNKVAISLENIFKEMAYDKLKIKPLTTKGSYFIIINALKTFTAEELVDLMVDWFDSDRPDTEKVQITRCLSVNHLNDYLARHSHTSKTAYNHV